MRVPNLQCFRKVREKRAETVFDTESALPILALESTLHFAAKIVGEQLQSITNPKNWNPKFEDRFIRQRRILRIHARRSARENNSCRIQRGDLILLVVFGAGLTWGAAVIEW